jgi:hypothetical protein
MPASAATNSVITRHHIALVVVMIAGAAPLHAQRAPHIQLGGGINAIQDPDQSGVGEYGQVGVEVPTRHWRVDGRFILDVTSRSAARVMGTVEGSSAGARILPVMMTFTF